MPNNNIMEKRNDNKESLFIKCKRCGNHTDDTMVNNVVEAFLTRSNVGKEKYGTTLDRNDLKPLQWLIHLQEELMDATLYVEKLKKELGNLK